MPGKTNRSGLPEGYSLVEGTGLKKWEVFGPGTSRYSSGQTKAEAIGSFWDMHGKAGDYTGGHYGEYPNVLAHVRFNDRVSKHGKTLNIEEIQSDLHQEGRKKGYRDDKAHARLSEELKVAKSEYEKVAAEWHEALKSGGGFDMRGRKAEAAGRVRRAEEALESIGQVPDAPFKTSWHELAMKRMIRYAVDNGYDALSWTTGETQAARYD